MPPLPPHLQGSPARHSQSHTWDKGSRKPTPTLKWLFLPFFPCGHIPSLPHRCDSSQSPSLQEQPSFLLKTQPTPPFGFLLPSLDFVFSLENTGGVHISTLFWHHLEEPQRPTFSPCQVMLIAGTVPPPLPWRQVPPGSSTWVDTRCF